MEPQKDIKENILSTVKRDLEPSFFRVAFYLLLSFALGGFFSMFICGQFGIGLSSFALHLSHQLHSEMDPLLCAALCGGIFSIIPIFVLKLTTHPLLFRVITKDYAYLQAGCIFFFGLIVYSHSTLKLEFLSLILWSLSAYFASRILCAWHKRAWYLRS